MPSFPTTSSPKDSPFAEIRILFLVDDVISSKTVATQLARLGVSVGLEIVSTPTEAMARLFGDDSHMYDLILVDSGKYYDGFTFCESVRQMEDEASLSASKLVGRSVIATPLTSPLRRANSTYSISMHTPPLGSPRSIVRKGSMSTSGSRSPVNSSPSPRGGGIGPDRSAYSRHAQGHSPSEGRRSGAGLAYPPRMAVDAHATWNGLTGLIVHVPIVGLVHYSTEGVLRARTAGMDECLTKPVDRTALRGALEKYFPLQAAEASSTP